MAQISNIVRASIYAVVLLFSVICLAMSAHFQHVLSSSDLTRFVPFAIFVCSLSMVIFVVLLVTSLLLRERNPVSTRIELACLGLIGILWLSLGGFLASSDAQDADVECYASDTSQTPLDDSLASFHTNQYQAMYRVLMVCALLNAILILLCFFILGALVYRRHRNGDQHMWYAPVTSGAWLASYESGSGKPQRQRSASAGTRSTSNGGILPTHIRGTREKSTSSSRPSGTRHTPRKDPVYLTEKPERVYSNNSRRPSNGRRLGTERIVEGGMRNPGNPDRSRRN